MARTWRTRRVSDCEEAGTSYKRHALCLSRSSLLRGALMITRRTLEGALKWALRDFLREEWSAVEGSVSMIYKTEDSHETDRC